MLTPLDIEKKIYKRSLFGYSKNQVEIFMKNIQDDYEKVYMENIELKDKVSVINDALKHYKVMEETLQKTLFTAEKTANEVVATAQKKAEQIELEANNKGKQIISEAMEKVFDLNVKIDNLVKEYNAFKAQIKHLYKSQIEIMDKNDISSYYHHNSNELKESL